jgi:hypothetical protein
MAHYPKLPKRHSGRQTNPPGGPIIDGFRNSIINGNRVTVLPLLPLAAWIWGAPNRHAGQKARAGRTGPSDDNAVWLRPSFRRDFLGFSSATISV